MTPSNLVAAYLVAAYLSFVVGLLFGVAILRRDEGGPDLAAHRSADYERERREFEGSSAAAVSGAGEP